MVNGVLSDVSYYYHISPSVGFIEHQLHQQLLLLSELPATDGGKKLGLHEESQIWACSTNQGTRVSKLESLGEK